MTKLCYWKIYVKINYSRRSRPTSNTMYDVIDNYDLDYE